MKPSCYKYIIIFIFLFLRISGKAQEIPGIVTSNYSGVNGLYVNPSSLMHGYLYSDLNILGADIFAQNEFFYLNKKDMSVLKLIRGDVSLTKENPDDKIVNMSTQGDLSPLYANIRILGPAYMRVGEKYALAIHTGFRTLISGKSLPRSIMTFAFQGLEYKPQHDILYNHSDASIAALSYSEIGITFNHEIIRKRNNWSSLGITFRLLYGYLGTNIDIKNINYVVENDTTIDIRNISSEISFSAPINYSTNKLLENQIQMGSGFSVDIGYTWIASQKSLQWQRIHSPCELEFVPYKFKLGISLLDLGYISFNKNAQSHEFVNNSYYNSEVDTLEIENIQSAINNLSDWLYGNPNKSLKSESFTMMLPTVLSAQFDYHLRDEWYVNGMAFLALPISPINRPHNIIVSPRYESELFEAGAPLSLYNFTSPRIGLYFRLLGLTVGTDKLGTFLGLSEFYGMDFYFSLRLGIPWWIKGNCSKRKRRDVCNWMNP